MKIIDRIMKTCLICMNEHEVLIVRVHESTVFKGITVEYAASMSIAMTIMSLIQLKK